MVVIPPKEIAGLVYIDENHEYAIDARASDDQVSLFYEWKARISALERETTETTP